MMRSNRHHHAGQPIDGLTPASQYPGGGAVAQRSPASATKGQSPHLPFATPFANAVRNHGGLVLDVVVEGVRRRFRRGDPLGKGGFATVYNVVDENTGQEFAAKFMEVARILNQKHAADRTTIEREINIHRQLDHPNVLKMHGAFKYHDEHGRLFYVAILDLCGYGSLYDFVMHRLAEGREQPLTTEEAQYVLLQLIQGLAHLHQQKVMHRDLKPGNILVDDYLRIKIADFGLATTYGVGQLIKQPVGTPNYMAPEVVVASAESTPVRGYDYHADMWSLGIIGYALFHRTPPFQGVDVKATNENVLRGDYSFVAPGMPRDARDLVAGLLKVDPILRLNKVNVRCHEFLACVPNDALPPDSMIAHFAALGRTGAVDPPTLKERVLAAAPSQDDLEQYSR